VITLKISRLARTDLHEILAYVGERDARAAVKLVSAILEKIDTLRDHPYIGRNGRVKGTRELILPDERYIVAYRVPQPATVEILRILHSARRWPKKL
jgi:addiction module RelE/StbE family toxin